MIYGATGYTGKLIARAAAAVAMEPIIAGRSQEKVKALADELSLAQRVFALADKNAAEKATEGINVLLNCAGPFSATAAPLMDICLKNRVHYLDITGEIDVFESAAERGDQAREVGIVLCPGAGFDVIPTDCLAALLKSALPDACALTLGFSSSSGPSRGTAKTSIEGLSKGIRIRRDGKIIRVRAASKPRKIDFGAGDKTAIRIPWGDVSTAYHSTGISNIEVYVPFREKDFRLMKVAALLGPILRFPPLQYLINLAIDRKVSGPDQQQLQHGKTLVWGEIRNAAGLTRQARFTTSNGYRLTVDGSLAIVKHLLHADPSPAGGFYTPSKLMGIHFVSSLPGTGEIEIT